MTKTKVRHSCLTRYKTRCTPVKLDRKSITGKECTFHCSESIANNESWGPDYAEMLFICSENIVNSRSHGPGFGGLIAPKLLSIPHRNGQHPEHLHCTETVVNSLQEWPASRTPHCTETMVNSKQQPASTTRSERDTD